MTTRRSSQTTSLCTWQNCDSACELCLSKRTQHCAHACMHARLCAGWFTVCRIRAPQMSETLSCSTNGGWCWPSECACEDRCQLRSDAELRTSTPTHPRAVIPVALGLSIFTPFPPPPCTGTPQRNLRHLFVKVDNFDRTKHQNRTDQGQ